MFEEMKGARIHIFEETEVESTASPSFVELRNNISSMDEVDFEQGGSVVHMRKRANADSYTPRKTQ